MLEKGSNPFGEIRAAVDPGVHVVVLDAACLVVEASPEFLGGRDGQRGTARYAREQLCHEVLEFGGAVAR